MIKCQNSVFIVEKREHPVQEDDHLRLAGLDAHLLVAEYIEKFELLKLASSPDSDSDSPES